MYMAVDNEDRDFELRLAEKRHKGFIENQQKFLDNQQQFLTVMRGVSVAINKTGDNKEIVSLVQQYTKEIANFAKEVKALKIDVAAPTVTVETNQDKVVVKFAALENKLDVLISGISRTNELLTTFCEPKDYDFEFTRNQWGALQSPIKAKSKKPTYKN